MPDETQGNDTGNKAFNPVQQNDNQAYPPVPKLSPTPEVNTPVAPMGLVDDTRPPQTELTAPALPQFIMPATVAQDATPEEVVTPPVRKNRKPLIVGIILTVVVSLIGAGSALAYGVWYQNPDRVIGDALINAMAAKTSIYEATIKSETTDFKLSVDVTAKQAESAGSFDAKVIVTTGGKNYTLNGSALVDSASDIYVKVENLNDIVTELKSQLGTYVDPATTSTIDKLVAKIDGVWIKISTTDLRDLSDTAAASKTCIDETIKKFKDDKGAISEVTNIYRKYPFLQVDEKLGEKDGSIGYKIKGDAPSLKLFAENVKSTKIYTSLHDCDETFVIDPSTIVDSDTGTNQGSVELWVSRWSHQITKLSFSGTSEGSTTTGVITPTYNKPVEIVTPSTSITLSQLKADLEELFQSATADLTSNSTSVEAANNASMVAVYAEMYASNNRGSYPSLIQLIPTLQSDGLEVLATVPGAANPTAIGYIACGAKGADVSYYNTSTGTVEHESVGRCS